MNDMPEGIPANRAFSLSGSAKQELYDQTAAVQSERVLMGKAALRVGYLVGGAGALMGLAGMLCAATLFPLKTRDVDYFVIDQSTGFVGLSMGPRMRRHYLPTKSLRQPSRLM